MADIEHKDAAVTRPSPLILDLPQELLLDILLFLTPQHISAFSQTCWRAHNLIEHSSYLWRTVYRKSWDPVGSSYHDVPTLSPAPQRHVQSPITTRTQTRSKGKGKAKATSDAESTAYLEDRHLSLQSLTKRRARAFGNLVKGAADPKHMLVHHEWTLRELIAAARSRWPREYDQTNPNAELPHSRTASTLSSFFPPNRSGAARWATYIYPRQDIDRLLDWQHDVAHPLQSNPVRATASSDQAEPSKRRKRSASDGANRTHIPRKVRKLLIKRSNTTLAQSLLDCKVREELSAELHVLHGIRRMQRDTPMDKLEKATTRFEQMRSGMAPDTSDSEDDDDDGYSSRNRPSSRSKSSSLLMDLDEEDMRLLRGFTGENPTDHPVEIDIDGLADLSVPGFLAGRDLESSGLSLGAEDGPSGDPRLQARAKSVVYDAGRFAYENAWGPLKPFRDSRDRTAPPGGPFLDGTDSEDEEDEDFQASDAQDDESSDDSGDHHDDPIVIDETVEHHEQQNGSASGPAGDGVLATNDASDNVLQVEEDDSSSNFTVDDEDEAALSEDSFEDIFMHREDHFARRVAWVGAYAGSKVRGDLLEMQKAPGQSRAKSTVAKPWNAQRQVDWVVLESIMVTAHCALVRGVSDGWGQGFCLPPGARGDPAKGDASLMSDATRNMQALSPPKSWTHSRGTVYTDDANPTPPRDWANVESATWTGTYFFSDYPVFLKYNSVLAQSADSGRGRRDGEGLSVHREAIGDCLALRLELLSPAEEAETKEREISRGDSVNTMGPDDPEYPTLRFKGRTFTYTRDGVDPSPRGTTYGFVRPIYATPEEQAHRPYLSRYHAATKQYLPEIVALHWKIVHAYEGEDRWSLTGIQVGPPGTRAPIYGMWSDVEDGRGAPVGPFVYCNVDSRPWKEVLGLIEEYRRRGR